MNPHTLDRVPTDEVRGRATGPPKRSPEDRSPDALAEGTFGRWVVGHPLVLAYANVPALIMPTLHPTIAHVLSEKDRTLNGSVEIRHLQDGARRLFSTYEMVMSIVFAGPEAEDVAHGLHELHRPVAGKMPEGRQYHAWSSDVWNWTWGPILKGGIDVADEFGLTRDKPEREAAYEALNELGRRFGPAASPTRSRSSRSIGRRSSTTPSRWDRRCGSSSTTRCARRSRAASIGFRHRSGGWSHCRWRARSGSACSPACRTSSTPVWGCGPRLWIGPSARSTVRSGALFRAARGSLRAHLLRPAATLRLARMANGVLARDARRQP